MTASHCTPPKGQESSGTDQEQLDEYVDVATQEFDDLADQVTEFLEDISDQDASEDQLLQLHRDVVSAMVALRDAATVAGVIDDECPQHRAVEQALKATSNVSLEAMDDTREWPPVTDDPEVEGSGDDQ